MVSELEGVLGLRFQRGSRLETTAQRAERDGSHGFGMREKESFVHARRIEKGVIRDSQKSKVKPEKLSRTELCVHCQVW